MSAAAPWTKYREHAAAYAYADAKVTAASMPGTEPTPYYMRAVTPVSSGEWAQRMRRADPAHSVTISEPTASNPMQSAPLVLFAAYDARGPHRTAAHERITKTHPYVITTYAEGDLITEFYPTAEARDRALYLLERAL
jgi:hypothetical protein